MWKITNNETGAEVAQVRLEPEYSYKMLRQNPGVRSVLRGLKDLRQLNRTVDDDADPPQSLVLDESASPETSGEAWEDPSDDYRLGTIARRVRPGHSLVNTDGSGAAEAASQDAVDEAYQKFTDTVNMSASDLRDWSDHDCSDRASNNPTEVRQRVLNLLETDKADWGTDEVDAANRVVSFVSRMRGMEQGEATEDCPSDRDISLMNWGYRPGSVSL